MDANVDYYEILGIPSNSNADTIRTAYRNMAKRYHPDLNKDKHAEDKFKLVNEANDVLSNAATRSQYDMLRNTSNGFYYQPAASESRFYSDSNLIKNRDIHISYSITLEESFNGKTAVINYKPKRASSSADTIEIITVVIPKNCEEGHRIFVYGKGDDANRSIKPGNLIVSIHIQPHPLYTLTDNGNLKASIDVNVLDLLLGTEFLVTMVDQGSIKLKIKKGTEPGSVLKVQNRGCNNKTGGRGDVFFTINATMPSLTEDQENQLRIINESIKT